MLNFPPLIRTSKIHIYMYIFIKYENVPSKRKWVNMKFQYVNSKISTLDLPSIISSPSASKKKFFNFQINFQFSSIQKAIEKTSEREMGSCISNKIHRSSRRSNKQNAMLVGKAIRSNCYLHCWHHTNANSIGEKYFKIKRVRERNNNSNNQN